MLATLSTPQLCTAQVITLAVRILHSTTDLSCQPCLLEHAVAALSPPMLVNPARTRFVSVTAPNGRARSTACGYAPMLLLRVAGAGQRARAAAAVPS